MRTLRLGLAGTLTLLLLVTMPLAVVSQEDEGVAMATRVSGKIVSDENWSDPDSATSEAGVDQALGMRVERQIEWSDPRLPSTMTTVMNLDDYPDAMTWAQTHRLDGPDGAWAATERGFMDFSAGSSGLMVWTGEGAYEGLSALLMGTVTDTGETLFEGFIFEGGLPPMPGPVEPLGEESIAATVEPTLLQLTFDGESCTYEGPTELIPGSAELLFHNESEGTAATNMVSIDEGYTIQDMIDDLGPEPSTGHHPSWTREIAGTWRMTAPGESHHWEGDLEMGLYAMVCARLSPLGVWFGTGLTVDG